MRHQHSTKIERESKVCDGALFTVKRLSVGMRADVGAACRSGFAAAGLPAAIDLEKLTGAEWAIVNGITDRCYLRAGLKKLIGLDIDGESFDNLIGSEKSDEAIERLVNDGPTGLVEEIVAVILAEGTLSEADAKNSEPRTGE